jgi:Cdc6-like AAA superfamily ATPase
MKTNVEVAGEAVQELQLSHHQREIKKWLSAPDPSTNYSNALEKRYEDTGLWFINGEAFERWKERPNSFLWLHGIPGCGKTVLSSTIIEHLKSNIEPDQPLLYFYFDFSDANKQTFENMLRSLVNQLYQEQPKTRHHLDQIWKSHKGSNQHLSKQSLKAILLAMLSDVNKVSIVLDALDESTTRREVTACLKSILELGSNCRILVTARREEDIETAFRHWTEPEDRISIRESDIDGDIRAYVSHTVRNSNELDRWQSRPGVQDEIESKLVERADGM